MVSLGGPGRAADRRHEADSAIERLFLAGYPRLVRAAYSAAGDIERAERLAQDAYLRLWRRPRLVADARAADEYLLRAVCGPARRRALDAGPALPRPADIDRGWRELTSRRARWTRTRRTARLSAVTIAAACALAVAVPALLAAAAGSAGPKQAPTGRAEPSPRAYPGAIVARIPLSGVIDVAGDAGRVWAVRRVPTAHPAAYQLVGIDTRTNTVSAPVNLGAQPEAVAAGGGTVWVTTPSGSARGQLDRVDPATGTIVQAVHLRAGRCTFLAYSGGRLFAGCATSSTGITTFSCLDPDTGRVEWQAGSAAIQITEVAATPQGIWYADRYLGIAGPIAGGLRSRPGRLPGTPRPVGLASPQSLVYGDGFLWTLASDESVNKIDPANGRVTRYYSYRGYDPAFLGGLGYLTVGNGTLWFLDDRPRSDRGTPLTGVLAVSEGTGRPLGWIPAIAPRACGPQPCAQIYATQGAVWVPTERSLIRIAPARLPG